MTITYNQDLPDVPNYGCYPDLYANNVSDQPDDPGVIRNPMVDSSFEACGVVVFLGKEELGLLMAGMHPTENSK